MFSGADLSRIVWAMAALRHRPSPAFLRSFEAETERRLAHLRAAELVDVAWALAVFAWQPGASWVGALADTVQHRCQQGQGQGGCGRTQGLPTQGAGAGGVDDGGDRLLGGGGGAAGGRGGGGGGGAEGLGRQHLAVLVWALHKFKFCPQGGHFARVVGTALAGGEALNPTGLNPTGLNPIGLNPKSVTAPHPHL